MQAFLSLFFWLFALPETICLLKGFKGGMQNWFGFRRLRENCIKLQQKMTQNWRNIRQWFHRKRYLLATGGGKTKRGLFPDKEGFVGGMRQKKSGQSKAKESKWVGKWRRGFLRFPSLILSLAVAVSIDSDSPKTIFKNQSPYFSPSYIGESLFPLVEQKKSCMAPSFAFGRSGRRKGIFLLLFLGLAANRRRRPPLV